MDEISRIKLSLTKCPIFWKLFVVIGNLSIGKLILIIKMSKKQTKWVIIIEKYVLHNHSLLLKYLFLCKVNKVLINKSVS